MPPPSIDKLSPLSFPQRREATPQLHILLPENQKEKKKEKKKAIVEVSKNEIHSSLFYDKNKLNLWIYF